MRWWRRRPSRAQLIAAVEEAERARHQALADAAAATLAAATLARIAAEQTALARKLHLRVEKLTEPRQGGSCRKVRLRSREEAEEFAKGVLRDTGVACRPYACMECPRQPVSLERFWHITKVDRAQRGKPVRKRKHLLNHVSREDMDALRARFNPRSE